MNVNVAREKRDPGSRRAVWGRGIWWGRRETGTVGEGEWGYGGGGVEGKWWGRGRREC